MAPKYNNKLLQEEMLIALEQIPLALAAVGLPKVIPKIGMDDTGTLPKLGLVHDGGHSSSASDAQDE